MDASMRPGIWVGRAEDSDEHLVGTPQGVYRCRTVRRMFPERQWNAESFLSMKGFPWDTASGAVPNERIQREPIRFALPLPEVVRQPDSSLLTVAPTGAEEPARPSGSQLKSVDLGVQRRLRSIRQLEQSGQLKPRLMFWIRGHLDTWMTPRNNMKVKCCSLKQVAM